MNDRKADVIDALLAKAESTTSPEEAEALTAKAEALMLKYGIEAGDRVGGRAGGQAGRAAGQRANVGTTAVGAGRRAVSA